jgi:acyl-CoA synthetase (AMP-forming)/AMP-acid ligase II
MLSCPGVADAAAFSETNTFGIEELRIALVATGPLDEMALRRQCERVIPTELIPSHFIRVASLPRNTSGKLDRAALTRLKSND